MAIWLNLVIVAASLFDGSNSNAQELVKVPVQIPSIFTGRDCFCRCP